MALFTSVLLVDDDSTTNFLNQSLLKRLGVASRISIARDGREALDYLDQHCAVPTDACPALILLDLNMPGMNGIEFMQEFQTLPLAQRREPVVVMLTTSMHPRDVDRARELRVDGFVNKPLTKEKISALLHTHFHRDLPE